MQALKNIELDVRAGEVLALVGDNGAGKSTLVKTIAGVYTADDGTMVVRRPEVRVGSPAEAQQLGIATVFQDLALCDNLDVVANLYLGRELRKGGLLDEVEMERSSWELLRQLSAKIPSVRIPVASLSGGQRQTVAIARSAARPAQGRDAGRADRGSRRSSDRRGPQPGRAAARARPRR